ncbi:MAG TPA: hypothetical protein VIX90_04450 [Edaphobacter sp.]
MSWRERAYVFGAICLSVLPLVLVLLLLLWRKDLALLSKWRRRISLTGIVLAFYASLPLPVFYVGLAVLPVNPRNSWFPVAATNGLLAGILAGLIAAAMLCFARGKIRWLGILSATLSVVFIYVALMALSF